MQGSGGCALRVGFSPEDSRKRHQFVGEGFAL
jgi:hypothetical protein